MKTKKTVNKFKGYAVYSLDGFLLTWTVDISRDGAKSKATDAGDKIWSDLYEVGYRVVSINVVPTHSSI